MKFEKCLFIGINYKDHQQGRLYGCVNDCRRWYERVKEKHECGQARILADEPDATFQRVVTQGCKQPTKENILDCFDWVTSDLKEGDNILVTYSGHGAYVKDRNGDEDDGFDETICPVDYDKNGDITDDEIRKVFVDRVPKGVNVYCVFDCCHSGTVLDLPEVMRVESQTHSNTQPSGWTCQFSGECQPQFTQQQFTLQFCPYTGYWYYVPVQQFCLTQQPYRRVVRHGTAEARNVLRTVLRTTRNGVTTDLLDYEIPQARFICFSGCRDDQTSADAREETDEGTLAVGACSNALLQALDSCETLGDILKDTRRRLSGRYEQVMQVTTSGFSLNDRIEF